MAAEVSTQNTTINLEESAEIVYKHGNLFSLVDTVQFISGSAVLVEEYELTSLLTTTHEIDTQIKQLEAMTTNLLKNRTSGEYRALFKSVLIKIANFSTYNQAIRNDMQDIFQSYSPITTRVKINRTRNKRFLNSVYAWLITLFSLNQGDEASDSEHTTAAEQTLIHLKKQELYQQHTDSMMNIVIPYHAKKLSIIQLLFQINTIDITLVNLSTYLNKIRNMMNSLLQSRATHDLISTTDFYDMLLHLEGQAKKKGLAYYHTLEKHNLAYFYQIATAKAEFVSETILRVAILVPLVKQFDTFQLTKITKIPSFFNNTSSALTYNFLGKYLIHNKDFYAIFNEVELSACKLQSPLLCSLPKALLRQNMSSCELALFKQDEKLIKTKCEIVIHFSSPPFFVRLSQVTNEWAYSVPKPMEFIPDCLSSIEIPNTKIILENSGIFQLPIGCTFKNVHVHLHVHDVFTHTHSSDLSMPFTPINFPVTMAFEIEQQINELTENFKIEIQNLSSTYGMPESIDLNSLIELIKEERTKAAAKRYSKPWHQRLTDSLIAAFETIAYSISICAATALFLRLSLYGCIECIKARRRLPPHAI